jgi:hypothetical protein
LLYNLRELIGDCVVQSISTLRDAIMG